MAAELTVTLPDEPHLTPAAAGALWRLLQRSARRRSTTAKDLAVGGEGAVPPQPHDPDGTD